MGWAASGCTIKCLVLLTCHGGRALTGYWQYSEVAPRLRKPSWRAIIRVVCWSRSRAGLGAWLPGVAGRYAMLPGSSHWMVLSGVLLGFTMGGAVLVWQGEGGNDGDGREAE